MDQIEVILSEWELRINQIKLFDTPEMLTFGNVNVAVDRFRSLTIFIRHHLPTLREWMNAYLEKNRKQIFIRFCGTQLHEDLLGIIHNGRYQNLNTLIRDDWDAVFGATEARFSVAHHVAEDLNKRISVLDCDDEQILAIHRGQDHTDDWWGCELCDSQKYRWVNELRRRFVESEHPLQNPIYRQHLMKTYATELEQLGDWEPPHSYQQIDLHKSFLQRTYMERKKKPGQTRNQQMKEMMQYLGDWSLPYASRKDAYHRFLQLWDTLDVIPFVIQLYLPDIIELEYI